MAPPWRDRGREPRGCASIRITCRCTSTRIPHAGAPASAFHMPVCQHPAFHMRVRRHPAFPPPSAPPPRFPPPTMTKPLAPPPLPLCAAPCRADGKVAHDGHTSAPLAQQQKAWGIAGDTRAVARTITLRMTDDMRFTPRHIEVREGETVRLRARNEGQALHEIVLGTKADLDAHAALMSQHPGMQHDGPSMAHVQAGQQRDIVWTFNRPGQFDFACLVAGHYQSGMTGTITVLPRKQ